MRDERIAQKYDHLEESHLRVPPSSRAARISRDRDPHAESRDRRERRDLHFYQWVAAAAPARGGAQPPRYAGIQQSRHESEHIVPELFGHSRSQPGFFIDCRDARDADGAEPDQPERSHLGLSGHGKLFRSAGHRAGARAVPHCRGRRRIADAGRGDQLRGLATALRGRSASGRAVGENQRRAIHDRGRRAAGVHRHGTILRLRNLGAVFRDPHHRGARLAHVERDQQRVVGRAIEARGYQRAGGGVARGACGANAARESDRQRKLCDSSRAGGPAGQFSAQCDHRYDGRVVDRGRADAGGRVHESGGADSRTGRGSPQGNGDPHGHRGEPRSSGANDAARIAAGRIGGRNRRAGGRDVGERGHSSVDSGARYSACKIHNRLARGGLRSRRGAPHGVAFGTRAVAPGSERGCRSGVKK